MSKFNKKKLVNTHATTLEVHFLQEIILIWSRPPRSFSFS